MPLLPSCTMLVILTAPLPLVIFTPLVAAFAALSVTVPAAAFSVTPLSPLMSTRPPPLPESLACRLMLPG
ncbi:hypothetical protein ACE3ZL_004493, partial [Salmonella enterica]